MSGGKRGRGTTGPLVPTRPHTLQGVCMVSMVRSFRNSRSLILLKV